MDFSEVAIPPGDVDPAVDHTENVIGRPPGVDDHLLIVFHERAAELQLSHKLTADAGEQAVAAEGLVAGRALAVPKGYSWASKLALHRIHYRDERDNHFARGLPYRRVSHWTVPYFIRAIVIARSTSSWDKVLRLSRSQSARAKSSRNRSGNLAC